jgi:hypothetical protein
MLISVRFSKSMSRFSHSVLRYSHSQANFAPCVRIHGKLMTDLLMKYRWIVILLGAFIAIFAVAFETKAQSHQGFIYGKIYTDNNTYTGALRWGNEEAFWTDLFNAAKTEDSFAKLVPEKNDDEDSWFNIDWSFGSIWENKTIHQFTCQFGNISEIIKTGKNTRLKFKNGGELVVSGEGYNDVGSSVQVTDDELGVLSIKWEKIERIQFLPTPEKLSQIFGMPLYGTVESVRREKFTGFIIWDNDERLTTDKLDGDSDDGDISLKFGDIASLERSGRGTQVTLKSGREFYLTGSNDVNDENRGVIVITEDLGIVKLSWDAFRRLTFATPSSTGQGFNDFKSPKVLRGSVTTVEDESINGRIIFDIDEALDFEIIEGKENDIEYSIPFTLIRKITPKNYDYSVIELKSGKSVMLGDARDISSDNAGVLVFEKSSKKPRYFSWKKIIEIKFN